VARLARHRGELNTLRPAELADLLEDLGRRQGHELLELVGPDTAADALEEVDTDQWTRAVRSPRGSDSRAGGLKPGPRSAGTVSTG
jgi:Mg/Co/Ni transporter MgtE